MTDTILKAFCFVGLLFVIFLAGIVAGIERTYFYWKVQDVYLYREAKTTEVALDSDWFSNLFSKARSQDTGVTVYQPAKSLNGYTFFTDATSSAYLIDMHGHIAHQWHFAFRKAFPGKDPGQRPAHWRTARLMPDGSVFAIYEIPGRTPFGGGLIKIDKDSHLIWKYPGNVHHNVDIAPVLAQEDTVCGHHHSFFLRKMVRRQGAGWSKRCSTLAAILGKEHVSLVIQAGSEHGWALAEDVEIGARPLHVCEDHRGRVTVTGYGSRQFQFPYFFPRMSMIRNAAVAPTVKTIDVAVTASRVRRILALMDFTVPRRPLF